MNQLVKPLLSLGALGAIALMLPACSDDGPADDTTPPASTPTATQPANTPTPTAAPTPTAVPGPTLNHAYRMSSFTLAEGEGVDFDESGSPDNGFIPLYELSINIIGSAVFTGAYDTLIENGVPGQQAILIAQNLQDSFETAFSVSSFNTLTGRAINTDGWNLILTLTGEPEAFTAAWVMAIANEDGSYARVESVGASSGTLSGTTPDLSATTLTLDFTGVYSSAASGGSATGERILLKVEQAQTPFTYSQSALTNGDIGGVVWEDAMLDFMVSLIPTEVCSPQGQPCAEFDILEETILALEDEYNDPSRAALWELSGASGKGVFVGYGFEAGVVEMSAP